MKTAYEMRISDWSADVCSADLRISPIVLLWYSIAADSNIASLPAIARKYSPSCREEPIVIPPIGSPRPEGSGATMLIWALNPASANSERIFRSSSDARELVQIGRAHRLNSRH